MAYSYNVGTTLIDADNTQYRITITSNRAGWFNVNVEMYLTSSFDRYDSLDCVCEILNNYSYKPESVAFTDYITKPTTLNTWLQVLSKDLNAEDFFYTPKRCRFRVDNYNSTKGRVSARYINFTSDWEASGYTRQIVNHLYIDGGILSEPTIEELHTGRTYTLSTFRNGNLLPMFTVDHCEVDGVTQTTYNATYATVNIFYSHAGNYFYNKIMDLGTLPVGYNVILDKILRDGVIDDDGMMPFTSGGIKVYKFNPETNMNITFSANAYNNRSRINITYALITDLNYIDLNTGYVSNYLSLGTNGELMEYMYVSANTDYYIVVIPDNYDDGINTYDVTFHAYTYNGGPWSSYDPPEEWWGKRSDSGERAYLLVRDQTLIIPFKCLQAMSVVGRRGTGWVRITITDLNNNEVSHFNRNQQGYLKISVEWDKVGEKDVTRSLWFDLYIEPDSGWDYEAEARCSLDGTEITWGSSKSAMKYYGPVVGKMQDVDGYDIINAFGYINYSEGNELVFYAMCDYYNTKVKFIGWYGNKEHTGTCYSDKLTFNIQGPANGITMWACFETRNDFEWDTPKTSGNIFELTANEWNRLVSYALPRYHYVMFSELKEIIYAEQGAVFTANHYNYVADALGVSYRVQTSDIIYAYLLNALRDKANE